MQQFNVTKKNGVVLTESFTVGLVDENIVTVKADSDGNSEIVYADTLDRRIKPKYYTVTNTYATVAGMIGGAKIAVTVLAADSAATFAMTIQERFIREVTEAYATVNNTITACRKVTYVEGAFATKTVYVSNSLASLCTAVVTTTTPEATTTTTPEATTTTTPD